MANELQREGAEAALNESEECFQAIFAQAAVGIAQIGLDGAWLLVNNRFCQMLGYSEAELRRRTLQDITHPDDNDESLKGRRQLLAGEISSHTMEKRYIRQDGTIFWGGYIDLWCGTTATCRNISSLWSRTLPRRYTQSALFGTANNA